MITANQLLVHLIGDYILQSDWMANNKTKANLPAIIHACTYSGLFLLFKPSYFAMFIIISTHFFIDRYRLARYIVWGKNFLAPFNTNLSWKDCQDTGYSKERPIWLSIWLLIIADNILHILINGLALKYF